MTLQLHGLIVAVIAMAAAWLMVQAGLAKKALEHKHALRACPSCGRRADVCRCAARD